jgi:uncharacterized protein
MEFNTQGYALSVESLNEQPRATTAIYTIQFRAQSPDWRSGQEFSSTDGVLMGGRDKRQRRWRTLMSNVIGISNEQTVREVYAAFLRGDVAAIVSMVTDDVDWRNDRVESRECPWNGNFTGKSNLPQFFDAVAGSLDISVFDVRAIAASGAHVAVSLRIESTVKRTGRALKNDSMHLWTFAPDGRISAYRHYNDTAAELAAWRD